MKSHLHRSTRGFTMVELLVVIAIMGTLMAMLLPAVNSARETSRQNTCRNSLRSLAQATQTYLARTNKREFPGYRGNPLRHITDAPWLVTLLPNLDEKPEYDKWQSAYENPSGTQNGLPPTYLPGDPRAPRHIAILICPSDPPEDPDNHYLSYVMNCGYYDDPSASGIYRPRDDRVNAIGLDLRTNPSLGPRPQPCTDSAIVDGVSKTLLYSENIQAKYYANIDPSLTPKSDDQEAYVGFLFNPDDSAISEVEYMNGIMPNWNRNNQPAFDTSSLTARPSSYHPTICNFAFADSHVQAISDNVRYDILRQLMTPDHKKSIMKDITGNAQADTFGDADY